MATSTDDFNRADGALGANWLTWWTTAFVIISNTTAAQSGNTCGSSWNTASTTFTGNHKSTLTVVSVAGGGSNDCGPAVRCSSVGGGQAYVLSAFDGVNIQLYRVDAGSGGSALAQAAGVYSPGDVIELEANAALITVRKNGSTIFTYTDPSPLTGGQPGMYGFSGDVTWDSFVGADVSVGDIFLGQACL